MRHAVIIALVILGCASSQAARASDWHYCLAASHDQKTIYFSEIFESDAALEILRGSFSEVAKRQSTDITGVQCPRAGNRNDMKKAVEAMIAYQRARMATTIKLRWP